MKARAAWIVLAAGALLIPLAATAADPPQWAQTGRPLPEPELLQPTLDARLPAYRPSGVTGRLEGSAPPILAELVGRWLLAFREREPGVQIEVPPPYLPPQGSLNPRLRDFLEGRLDFAFLTREMAESDLSAFRRAHRFDPLQLPVGGGSFRHFGFVDAVAVVVHPSNPLRAVTLAQLDAVFSRTRHRGMANTVATWDELGVREWAGRPVRVVGTGAWAGEESARATFFRERVMDSEGEGEVRRGEWRRDEHAPDAGDAIVTEAVSSDPLAIGITAMGHLGPGVRALAIAVRPGSAFLEPSHENVARASYPLSRVFYLVMAREPGHALPPPLEALTRFLVSREGQAVLLAQGVFLPLRATQAAPVLDLLSAGTR